MFNKELNKSIKDLQGALQQMKNEQERLQREKEDSLQQIKDLQLRLSGLESQGEFRQQRIRELEESLVAEQKNKEELRQETLQ